MLSKQDLQDRVRRLEQLAGGLNAELVRLAMGAEPMLECYREASQAVARIGREEEQ